MNVMIIEDTARTIDLCRRGWGGGHTHLSPAFQHGDSWERTNAIAYRVHGLDENGEQDAIFRTSNGIIPSATLSFATHRRKDDDDVQKVMMTACVSYNMYDKGTSSWHTAWSKSRLIADPALCMSVSGIERSFHGWLEPELYAAEWKAGTYGADGKSINGPGRKDGVRGRLFNLYESMPDKYEFIEAIVKHPDAGELRRMIVATERARIEVRERRVKAEIDALITDMHHRMHDYALIEWDLGVAYEDIMTGEMYAQAAATA